MIISITLVNWLPPFCNLSSSSALVFRSRSWEWDRWDICYHCHGDNDDEDDDDNFNICSYPFIHHHDHQCQDDDEVYHYQGDHSWWSLAQSSQSSSYIDVNENLQRLFTIGCPDHNDHYDNDHYHDDHDDHDDLQRLLPIAQRIGQVLTIWNIIYMKLHVDHHYHHLIHYNFHHHTHHQ